MDAQIGSATRTRSSQGLTVCWSVKGGSGTTVVAAALALVLGRRSPTGALLVDLAGDALAAIGVEERSDRRGVLDWLAADASVGAGALASLEVPVEAALAALALGRARREPAPQRWVELVEALRSDERHVIVDVGSSPPGEGSGRRRLASEADASLLVLRPCYLAVRLAIRDTLRPTGVVLVAEEARALARHDIERALGVPVIAEVPFHAGIARAVDAGLTTSRLPRVLERAVRHAA